MSASSNTRINYVQSANGVCAYDWKGQRLDAVEDDTATTTTATTVKKNKTIVVFGATGGSGKEVVKQALLRGHRVIAAVRNTAAATSEFPGDQVEIRHVNMYDKESVVNAVRGADVIVSTLGAGSFLSSFGPTDIYSQSARNILHAMRQLGIKRVLLTTSVGVDYDPDFSWLYRAIIRRLIMNTYMDMMKLETIVEESYGTDIQWTLLRPSYLYNSQVAKDFFAMERAAKGGNYSISRTDFAKFIVNELENDRWVHGHPALSCP